MQTFGRLVRHNVGIGLAVFHPERFPYFRFGLALAIGAVGALVFLLLKLPLAKKRRDGARAH